MIHISFFSAAVAILMSFCLGSSAHAAAPEEQLIEAVKVALGKNFNTMEAIGSDIAILSIYPQTILGRAQGRVISVSGRDDPFVAFSASFPISANDRSVRKTLIQLKLCKAGCVRIQISCFRLRYVMKNNHCSRTGADKSKFIVGERYENHDHADCLDCNIRHIDRRGAR